MALNTIGSIAIHILNSFSNIPANVSGTMVDIVYLGLIDVQNYTGQTIGSNSIDAQYQSAIVSFAKSHLMTELDADSTGNVSLEGLSVGAVNYGDLSTKYHQEAIDKLKFLGMNIKVKKVLT